MSRSDLYSGIRGVWAFKCVPSSHLRPHSYCVLLLTFSHLFPLLTLFLTAEPGTPRPLPVHSGKIVISTLDSSLSLIAVEHILQPHKNSSLASKADQFSSLIHLGTVTVTASSFYYLRSLVLVPGLFHKLHFPGGLIHRYARY